MANKALLLALLVAGCNPSRTSQPEPLEDLTSVSDLSTVSDLAPSCSDAGQRRLTETSKIVPYYMAHDVSISGSTVALGYYADAVVRIFDRQGAVWNLKQTLNGPAGSAFGYRVIVQGDSLFVGARGGGFASVYTRSAGMWIEKQKLVPTDLPKLNDFGVAMALDGNTLVITDHSTGQLAGGAAYVFTESAGQWGLQQKITALDGQQNDSVGNSVSISGDSILVGAQAPGGPGTNPGAAYVYSRANGRWTQQQKLAAPDRNAGVGDAFGGSVGLSGDVALIGAYWANPNKSGALYLFTRSTGSWTFQKKLMAPGMPADAQFSYPLSAKGRYALIGGAKVPRGAKGVGTVALFSVEKLSIVQNLSPSDADSIGFGQAGGVSMDEDQAVVLGSSSPSVAAYLYSFGGQCSDTIQ